MEIQDGCHLITKCCVHTTIKTNVETRIASSEPLGIGLIAAVGPYLLVNNIGSNLEISLADQRALAPQAYFVETAYPHDPDDASFDLDMHALIYAPEWGRLLALNHDGRLRFFKCDEILANADINSASAHRETEGARLLLPELELFWKGDVDRSLLIGNCLVSTSPLGYRNNDPPEPGLFISEPFTPSEVSGKRQKAKLGYKTALTELGTVSAIAFDHRSNRLALASSDKISLWTTSVKSPGFSLDKMLWQSCGNFHTTFLAFQSEGLLIAAGYALGLTEDYTDPNSLEGGGFAALNLADGNAIHTAGFASKLAWGTGGQCLTLSKNGRYLLGFDRQAGLYRWGVRGQGQEVLFEGAARADAPSLGIAHPAWIGNRLFCGFNRDTHRLHVYDFETMTEMK